MKRILFVFLFATFAISCGTHVSENIPVPGITTGPLDLIVKDICGNPIKDLEIYVSGITETVKTGENGEVHIKSVFKPYFITFKREGEPYLTYRSERSSLEVFDINSSCETYTSSVTGGISMSSSLTGSVKIFAYPGGITETTVDGGKGEYSMDLKFPKVPTSSVLVGVYYEENDKPKLFGKNDVQFTKEGESITSPLNLLYEPIIPLSVKIIPPSGIDEKIEISYYFLFGGRWNDKPIYKEIYQKKSSYELKLPNPDMLSKDDGFIVIGRAENIDERGTPSELSDDEITGSVSINFINKSSAKDKISSLDLSFPSQPIISKPSSDEEFKELPDVEWESSLTGFTLIEFSDSKGNVLWRIVVDGGERKVSSSKIAGFEKIKLEFSSLRHYFISVYTYPVELSYIKTIFADGEWWLYGNGYSYVKGRRFYLE